MVDWLREVYGAEQIPPYEKTERSITILHQLMIASRRSEDSVKILAEDYAMKASEYDAEGRYIPLCVCFAFVLLLLHNTLLLSSYNHVGKNYRILQEALCNYQHLLDISFFCDL